MRAKEGGRGETPEHLEPKWIRKSVCKYVHITIYVHGPGPDGSGGLGGLEARAVPGPNEAPRPTRRFGVFLGINQARSYRKPITPVPAGRTEGEEGNPRCSPPRWRADLCCAAHRDGGSGSDADPRPAAQAGDPNGRRRNNHRKGRSARPPDGPPRGRSFGSWFTVGEGKSLLQSHTLFNLVLGKVLKEGSRPPTSARQNGGEGSALP